MGLRENSTEHNLSHYQVGPQSGPNAGLGGLSEAYKEPDNTFSMPDPTNSLRVRSTFSMPDDGIRTSSPITHSLYPTQTFHIEPNNPFSIPADTIRLSGHHPPPPSGSRACLCLCPYAGLSMSFHPAAQCIWPGILQLDLAGFIAACNALPSSTIPRCSTSRDALAARQQSRKSTHPVLFFGRPLY